MKQFITLLVVGSVLLASCTTTEVIQSVKDESFNEEVKQLLVVVPMEKIEISKPDDDKKILYSLIDDYLINKFKVDFSQISIETEYLKRPILTLDFESKISEEIEKLKYWYVLTINIIQTEGIVSGQYGGTYPQIQLQTQIEDWSQRKVIWKFDSYNISGYYKPFTRKAVIQSSRLDPWISAITQIIFNDFNR